MLEQIRGLGDQLRWALGMTVPHVGVQSEVLYAGMGGSGIAGDYLTALVEPTSARVQVHKGYGPVPSWAIRQRPLALAVSYSGNTEETLDFATAAHEQGLPVAAVTTGGTLGELARNRRWPMVELPPGLQPRAALGQGLGAVIRLLEGAGVVLDHRTSMAEAARLVDEATEDGSPAWEMARGIADGLRGRIPIIYGGGSVTVPVAQRWKAQINENSKMPAWWSPLPELNHNELAGWESMPETTRDLLGVVALRDRSDHDRIGDRFAHTRTLTEHAVPWVGEVEAWGVSVLARLMTLTVVGDLVSWMLADQAGVDPVPVAIIEDLKKLLSKETE
jgi:glucose/mannose-6-phosphate isomerase